jgi:uncharacterized protein YecE (DUF72 family)
MAGRLYTGTSGFAYRDWAPRFYPPGTPAAALLPAYAARLPAVELNNTFYRHPTPDRIDSWLSSTPEDFRFSVKTLRTGSMRAYHTDPPGTLTWLVEPLTRFGPRLGAVLFRVAAPQTRDDARLAALLGAWPTHVPLVLEFQDASWHADEVFDLLRRASAVLCLTDLPDAEAPTLRATGPFLYLRLRREDYETREVAEWAARIEPFLADGRDAYVFFRHDPVGRAAELALELAERLPDYRVR